MTRRDWWCGIAGLALVLLLHALVPRYEWRSGPGAWLVRIDRWTGTAQRGTFSDGVWSRQP